MSIVVTLLADLVGSRRLPDRAATQRRLARVLDEVNAAVPSVQPIEPTVGDEFQGAYHSLPTALRAAQLLRLGALPDVDVRIGLGRGEVAVHDASRRPVLQDGPGWWAARSALETLSRHRDRRTWYADPERAAYAGAVDAWLLCRDRLVDQLNDRGRAMVRLALLGHTQREIAESLAISPSAVSQQFRRGVGASVDSHTFLIDPEEGLEEEGAGA